MSQPDRVLNRDSEVIAATDDKITYRRVFRKSFLVPSDFAETTGCRREPELRLLGSDLESPMAGEFQIKFRNSKRWITV